MHADSTRRAGRSPRQTCSHLTELVGCVGIVELSDESNIAKTSYVNGAGAEPLIGTTVGMHLDQACARYADQLAVIVRHQGIGWTYREFKKRIDAVAAAGKVMKYVIHETMIAEPGVAEQKTA